MSTDNSTIRALLERPARAAATDENHDADAEYTAFSYGRLSSRPQMTLMFRKPSGEVFGFPYALLTGIRSDDSESGFMVEFGQVTVVVSGRNLGKLFRYICEHRAAEVAEGSRSMAVCSFENECIVEAIQVQRHAAREDAGMRSRSKA